MRGHRLPTRAAARRGVGRGACRAGGAERSGRGRGAGFGPRGAAVTTGAAAEPLGVAIHGAGWVAAEYLKAFSRHPDVRVRVVSSRREESARARLAETGVRADVE